MLYEMLVEKLTYGCKLFVFDRADTLILTMVFGESKDLLPCLEESETGSLSNG